jgi:ankyrin repeat protein
MDGIIEDSEVTAVTDDSNVCKIKHERLIELVRITEETEISDYMGAMSEINSLVYDFITSDQSKSQAIVQEDPALLPECHVCMALKVIGNEDMAAKVESERVLLEAIAVTEGRFGEDHRGAFHFRVKLFLLYENWECRADSTCSLLLRIMLLTLHKVPTGKAPDLISDLLELPDSAEPVRCEWLQGSSRAQSLDASSYQLSTLSIRDNKGRNSPRKVWSILSAIADRVGWIDDNESKDALESFLELILDQGPHSADGSSYFWMATFISALLRRWGAIYKAKIVIKSTASERFPGSDAIKSSLEQLLENPYRLKPSAAPAVEHKPYSEPSNGASPAKGQSKFDNISLLKGPLENLEELRLVLAEASLWELEQSDHQSFSDLTIIGVFQMCYLLSDASRFGNTTLIQKLGKHFENETFGPDYPFSDVLNLEGEVAKWATEGSPLHLAISAGHYLTVDALLNAGADPNGPGICGSMTLEVAAEHGHDNIVRLLIRRGANVSVDNRVLRIVFRASDQEFHEECLENLHQYGDMCSLLCSIAFVGQYERYGVLDMVSKHVWKVLSKRDKNPSSGRPVLRQILVPSERKELHDILDGDDSGRGVELVLDVLAGVHIEQQARGILKTAIFGSTAAIIDTLHPTKASEFPPMHKLVSRNAPNALGVFLELDPDLASLDTQGNTSLHVAAARNRVACAQQLLQSGIDVDVENNDGETAFEIAVRAGHRDIGTLIVHIMGSVDGGEI